MIFDAILGGPFGGPYAWPLRQEAQDRSDDAPADAGAAANGADESEETGAPPSRDDASARGRAAPDAKAQEQGTQGQGTQGQGAQEQGARRRGSPEQRARDARAHEGSPAASEAALADRLRRAAGRVPPERLAEIQAANLAAFEHHQEAIGRIAMQAVRATVAEMRSVLAHQEAPAGSATAARPGRAAGGKRGPAAQSRPTSDDMSAAIARMRDDAAAAWTAALRDAAERFEAAAADPDEKRDDHA